MTNGVKNPSPHPEFNILFITNFQIPAKGTVIPAIRKKKKRYLQEIVIAGNLVSEIAEVHKNTAEVIRFRLLVTDMSGQGHPYPMLISSTALLNGEIKFKEFYMVSIPTKEKKAAQQQHSVFPKTVNGGLQY